MKFASIFLSEKINSLRKKSMILISFFFLIMITLIIAAYIVNLLNLHAIAIVMMSIPQGFAVTILFILLLGMINIAISYLNAKKTEKE